MIRKNLIKIFIIFLSFICISCETSDQSQLKEFENYDVILSNNDYDINLNNGFLESSYFEIKDSIKFSENEKLAISKLFFSNRLDKLKGDLRVRNDDNISIQPDIGSSIEIKYFKYNKSLISISGFADSLKVRKDNIHILRFESKINKILEGNKDFKKVKKLINSKSDDRIYL